MIAPPPAPWLAESSLWQLTECCDYSVDLHHWVEIASGSSTPVLDLGCGIGRVAHHLGRAGFRVQGIDSDPGIVADFNRTSPGPGVSATVGDVTDGPVPDPLEPESPAPDQKTAMYDRIFAPQQLIQIMEENARARLLENVAAHLTPGGIAAFALTLDLPTESLRVDLLPDVQETGGWIYSSRPVLIEADPDGVEVSRIRHRVAPDGDLTENSHRIRFHRLEPDDFAAELTDAGLMLIGEIEVPPTADHVGSLIITAGSGLKSS